ncbi:tyrosine-protein phosphatase [Flavobacterium psychrotrophum]|uniref:tyrosine-protein phosphatase n=1 Tax=Flavobacterium psychrotrophum TaxID=2294119 RepID=UPI000E30EED5|nr:tyrosine-protein phosphatase [Flavobacterium psychrotrophum]
MLKKLSFILFVSTLSSCSSFKFTEPEYAKDNTEKTVAVKGIANLRNVSGITNTEGKKLKDGLIYRSANLHGLKPKLYDDFEALGIKQVIDLRTPAEIAKSPDNIPPGVDYVNLAAFEDKGDQLQQARKLVLHGEVTRTDAENRMLDFYKTYAVERPEVIRDIVHRVLQADAPLLYHCTAGKDRTGIITALVLKVLRFDDATIYNDYLNSNNLRKDIVYKRLKMAKRAHIIYPKLDVGVLEKLSWIESGYLAATFDVIEQQYGSVDNYIHEVLQIDEPQRQHYIDKFTE